MGHIVINIKTEQGWHNERLKGIGGSDAASVLGVNPYKSNVDLWREKTGRKEPEDISEKPAVKYGKQAEEYLRALFMLDYPQYTLDYAPYDQHINNDYPFMRASFDGLLTDQDGTKGILEIKTTTIYKPEQWDEWDGRIPINYFCQVLHYFGIDEALKFCKLKAQIKYTKPNDPEVYATTRHYHILREKHLKDIELLMEAEKQFWQYVEQDKEPPMKLPEI